MTHEEFALFLDNFRGFYTEESIGRIQFLRYVLSKQMEMDDQQFALFIQTIFQIEISKKPEVKETFERIMKAGYKK